MFMYICVEKEKQIPEMFTLCVSFVCVEKFMSEPLKSKTRAQFRRVKNIKIYDKNYWRRAKFGSGKSLNSKRLLWNNRNY